MRVSAALAQYPCGRARSERVRLPPAVARGRRDRLPAGGRGRAAAAPDPRVAGDQAHLVAQRGAARGGRLRGDRARPARVRRLRPCRGRPLRRRRARARHGGARAGRAGPRAGDRLRRGPRRGGGAGHVAALRGARRPAGACSTRSRRCCPTGRREVPREVRMAADYFLRQARDADGLAAELDTPGSGAALRVAVLRLALLGRARDLHARGRGLHDRAVRGRGALPGLDRELRVRRRAPPARRSGCGSSSRTPPPR